MAVKVTTEQSAQQTENAFTLTTDSLAARLGIKPQTLRAALCRNGHYFGLRPWKTPGRFLLWPADSISLLIGRGHQALVEDKRSVETCAPYLSPLEHALACQPLAQMAGV